MSADNPASSEHTPVGSQAGGAPQDLPRVAHPQAHKFRTVFAALVGIAVAAVAIAVVVGARNSGPGTTVNRTAWSSWAPDSSGDQGVTEIANHLAPNYRFSPTQQMNTITPIALSQPTAAGTTNGSGLTIALDNATSSNSQSLVPLPGETVAYSVCGLGSKGNCALSGTPTNARMMLLRREALELALYTFKYISGAHNVVVVLPPGHNTQAAGAGYSQLPTTAALAFDRAQLNPSLQLPLARSLASSAPEVPQLGSWLKGPEANLVYEATKNALFSSQVQAQQIGGQLLVLTPLPTQ